LPIVVTLDQEETLDNFERLAKAFAPMLVTESERVTLSKLSHPSKRSRSIDDILASIVAVVKLVQLLKQLAPSDVTLDGTVTFVRPELLNAYSPINITLDGICRLVKLRLVPENA